MFESFVALFGQVSLRDLVDILVIAFVIYQALRLIKGTRAWQMTLGVISLTFFYYVVRLLDLRTVRWLLETFFPYLIFALLIVFQSEIRRALVEIGKGKIFRNLSHRGKVNRFEEIVLAATTLSGQRIGALIVFEGDIGLKTYIESGISLDANLTYDLLLTIFNPKGPLHDGAVMVKDGRIIAAGCFLPLTLDPYLSKELGTRHRAAIGITEETDAVAIVVSEETGKISAVYEGEMTRNLDGPRLMKILEKNVQSANQKWNGKSKVAEAKTERRRQAV